MKSRIIIGNGLLLYSTILILIFGFINSATAATYNCGTCNDCESRINSASAGDIVILTSDIINQTERCISWRNNNVEFDCRGHLIDGDGSGWDSGIYFDDRSNNIIRNCIITEFYDGIYGQSSDNNTITNNTVISNSDSGIYLSYSTKNIITNNTVNSNRWGTYIRDYSNDNTINSNNICFNTDLDFYLSFSSGNRGDENTCDKPGGWNDTGTTNCTHSCSGASICDIKGDNSPCDGKVDDFEVLDYIKLWSGGFVGDFDLLRAINAWANG